MTYLDRAVTDFGGIALRYGGFYGADNDGWAELVRKRLMPIVGDGSGLISVIPFEDAAAATVLALEHDGPAIYNIVDDEPAPAREWLPAARRICWRQAARRLPAWLVRLLAGGAAVVMSRELEAHRTQRPTREFGWTLRYPSWRVGFPAVYSASTVADPSKPRPIKR